MSSQKTNKESTKTKAAADQLSDKDLGEVAGGAGCIPPIQVPKPEPLPRKPAPDPVDPFDDDRRVPPPVAR